MKINKSYKYRIYPTKSQIEYIEGCFNACRYVYNVSLDCEQQLYQLGGKSNLSTIGLSYFLTNYKVSEPWLKNYDSLALAYEMENLSNSYSKFFKGGGFPKFKSKNDPKQSFRTRIHIEVFSDRIKIPKVKETIYAKIHRPIEGKLKQFTISRENGKYYVSAMCEIVKDIQPVVVNKVVGIDPGIKSFIVTSDKVEVGNPKFLSSELKYLKVLQQKLSRAKKGSSNREKIKETISTLHKKIANKRENFLHNESRKLVNEYDLICMEDLNVKGMTKSSKGTIEKPGKKVKQKSGLNRSLSDVSLGSFVSMINYKSNFDGKHTVKIDRFYPSSKTCNCCGTINKELKLSDRTWTCDSCGTELDRDYNAALNIKDEGKRKFFELKK
jgi:putative transposase